MIRGKRVFAKIDRVMRLLALITMEKMMVSAMWKGTRMVRNPSSMGELKHHLFSEDVGILL